MRYLLERGRLEDLATQDLAGLAAALISRAELRLRATARPALRNGDADGAYAAAYDAYRMAAGAIAGTRKLLETSPPGRFG